MSGSMKEIWAIVRRDKVKKTQEICDSLGAGSMSIHTVSGRGKQKGFVQTEAEAQFIPEDYSTAAPGLHPTPSSLATEGAVLTKPVTYMPKKLIIMVIPEALVKEVVDGIISVNKTGHPGDGKIFVFPVEESYRIRTGEHGLSSLDDLN